MTVCRRQVLGRLAAHRPTSCRVGPPLALTSRPYSTASDHGNDIAILGGGITGLASAYYITRQLPRAKVTIYEASDRLGGWLSSKRVPVKDGSILFEAGPRTLRPASNGVLSARLMQELDIAKDAIFPQRTSPAAQNRFVYYPDKLVRMPHPAFGLFDNLWSLLTEPVFQGALWAGLTEFSKKPRDSDVADESVGDFFSRRLSPLMVDRILSAVLHGIYAGDAYKLSARSLFSGPWRDEAIAGSIIKGMIMSRAEGFEVTKREAEFLKEMRSFEWDPLLKATLKDTTVFTFREGLGTITDALARHLVQNGNVEFKTSTPVTALSSPADKDSVLVSGEGSSEPTAYKTVISALTPAHLNALTHAQKPNIVPHIPSVTVMTVNLYYRTPDLNPPGFGYLIPRATAFEHNPERALGVVFDTAYSPSPHDLDTANWQTSDTAQLQAARDAGQLVNVNDFAWYNLPARPNLQDDVPARGTKLTVMLGGHWWDGWPAFPDEHEGLQLAKSLLARHLNITEEPEAWAVNLQRDCIPQYEVGHERKLRDAHNALWQEYRGRLRVAGNWMSGVGVNDCLRSAWDVVRNLKAGRDGTGLEHVGADEYVRIKPMALGGKEGDEGSS